jgi:hypothetical protein
MAVNWIRAQRNVLNFNMRYGRRRGAFSSTRSSLMVRRLTVNDRPERRAQPSFLRGCGGSSIGDVPARASRDHVESMIQAFKHSRRSRTFISFRFGEQSVVRNRHYRGPLIYIPSYCLQNNDVRNGVEFFVVGIRRTGTNRFRFSFLVPGPTDTNRCRRRAVELESLTSFDHSFSVNPISSRRVNQSGEDIVSSA